MKRVEKMNAVVVYLQQEAEFISRHNLYTIDVNRRRML